MGVIDEAPQAGQRLHGCCRGAEAPPAFLEPGLVRERTRTLPDNIRDTIREWLASEAGEAKLFKVTEAEVTV